VDDSTTSSFTVSWLPQDWVEDFGEGYRVQWREEDNLTWNTVNLTETGRGVNSVVISHADLRAGINYQVRVASRRTVTIDSEFYTYGSEFGRLFQPTPDSFALFGNPVTEDGILTAMTLRWSRVPSANSYTIQRRLFHPESDWVTINSSVANPVFGPNVDWTDNSLILVNGHVEYRIRANDLIADLNSEWRVINETIVAPTLTPRQLPLLDSIEGNIVNQGQRSVYYFTGETGWSIFNVTFNSTNNNGAPFAQLRIYNAHTMQQLFAGTANPETPINVGNAPVIIVVESDGSGSNAAERTGNYVIYFGNRLP
jgi:hypothetical protein